MATYDEFGLLHDNASEAGLPAAVADRLAVRRAVVEAPSGNRVSGIVWGTEPPQVVFLHGGAQNAHTWDTTELALGLPALAIDLPGHGHSAWRADKAYRPQEMADDIAFVMEALAPEATTLVGMSLGGLTALSVLAGHPDLARRLVLVDITPGVNQEKAEPIVSFITGPEVFESFDELLERTLAFNPTRSRSSLRRGILHNAQERPDGTWAWRYDTFTHDRSGTGTAEGALDDRFTDLWNAISEVPQPIVLVQGAQSGVVDDDDVAELQRRRPDAAVIVVEGAGHSVQGDRPLELARIIADVHPS